MAGLFGEHDKHLAQIEQRLGVVVISRGNRLAVTGPRASADIACDTLNRLYRRLQNGETVDAAEVERARISLQRASDVLAEHLMEEDVEDAEAAVAAAKAKLDAWEKSRG